MDTRETHALAETLRAVVAEHAVSLLLVEHDVPLVMRLCDRVHVLDFGVKIAEGTPAQVREDVAVRAAYLGAEIPMKDDVAGEARTS